jgi:hypothetical protein
MPLITPTEVSQIAFVNSLDPALILPVFISTAETKYIVPLVTQVIIDKITETPLEFTTLVDNYIKPYEAFCIKYMFYNQLLTETDTFPTSDAQRSAALQEVLSIMEVSRDLLSVYLNAEIFENAIITPTQLLSGFRTASTSKAASTTGSNVSETLSGASLDTLSDTDTMNFIQFTSGLLKKITWSNLKITLKQYFDTAYASLKVSDISFEFRNITPGTAQTYDLDIKASFPYTIESAILETDNGTLTGVSVNIGSIPVTSLSSLTVDTAVDETASNGSKSVTPGDRITIVTSTGYTGSPTLLKGKIKIIKS